MFQMDKESVKKFVLLPNKKWDEIKKTGTFYETDRNFVSENPEHKLTKSGNTGDSSKPCQGCNGHFKVKPVTSSKWIKY